LTTGSFPHDNFSSVYWIFTKLGHMIPLWKGKHSIYFGVNTIIPFDNLYRRTYFVMHTFLVHLVIVLHVLRFPAFAYPFWYLQTFLTHVYLLSTWQFHRLNMEIHRYLLKMHHVPKYLSNVQTYICSFHTPFPCWFETISKFYSYHM
jgi:hypothetical protein